MSYGSAVAKELLRITPTVPAVFRYALTDFELQGRRIPKVCGTPTPTLHLTDPCFFLSHLADIPVIEIAACLLRRFTSVRCRICCRMATGVLRTVNLISSCCTFPSPICAGAIRWCIWRRGRSLRCSSVALRLRGRRTEPRHLTAFPYIFFIRQATANFGQPENP